MNKIEQNINSQTPGVCPEQHRRHHQPSSSGRRICAKVYPTTSSPFHHHFDGLWRVAPQLLVWVSGLAVLVLVVGVMAVEVTAVLLLLKVEPGDQEACPRLVHSHPSGGRLASAGVVVCHCLEGGRRPESHRQCYIPRCFLYKFVRSNTNPCFGVGTYGKLPAGCLAYAGRLGPAQ